MCTGLYPLKSFYFRNVALDPECGPGGCGVTVGDWTWVVCLPRTCCDSHLTGPHANPCFHWQVS